MALKQYRFPREAVMNAGYAVADGREMLVIDSSSPPAAYGIVTQPAPKRTPSYRQRHKRRHTR